MSKTVERNKHVPCELQGGHEWSDQITSEDVLGNKITLVICVHCGRIRNGFDGNSQVESGIPKIA